ncbi:hypothetical protein R69927_07777 [Paraburkholderia domus]|nr:hypothetical protein R69927_07777 [Paraburkholderia domus]
MLQSNLHLFTGRGPHPSNYVCVICRIENSKPVAGLNMSVVEHGVRFPLRFGRLLKSARKLNKEMFVRQIQAHRIETLGAKQIARQRNLRVRRTERDDLRGFLDRVGDQVLDRDAFVGNAIHERRVRAVFQQAAHEVREQRFMRADRRIHAARTVQFVAAGDFLVQRLAHAVQALELVLAGIVVIAREVIDRGERVRVVRGELRIDRVGRAQQFFRARQVRHVRVDLARVDRIAFEAVHLRALDFGVPVRALHEAHHDAATATARQIDDVVDHERAAFLIRLHHEADAVPAGQFRIEAQRFEQVERDFEAVGFFGVDVQADVVAAREDRQRAHARQQFAHRAFLLRT